MTGPFAEVDPSRAVLILLLVGHFLADFLFQTRRMAYGKDRLSILAGHATAVLLVQLLAVIPYLSWLVAGLVAGIAALHALIDAAKARWTVRRPVSPAVLLLDQGAHIVVALAAWLLLRQLGVPDLQIPEAWLNPWLTLGVLLAAFAVNWSGGSAIVSAVLDVLSPELEQREESSGVRGSGRLIGILERTLTLILILFGQWAAVTLLLAAKSVARFEELKERHFAEYYLVGTLTSLLVAIVIGVALKSLGF